MSSYIEVSEADIMASIIVTKTGVMPDPGTDLLTIEASTAHEAGKIYQDALAYSIAFLANLYVYIKGFK